jgi:transcriptional regulator
MYMPKLFQEKDRATLHQLMQTYSFATLVTLQDGLPYASHVPLLLRPDDGPYGTLVGHLARANPQWRHFDPDHEVLVIFQGPHTYVSPSWYEVHPSVPTWNYTAVHAYGTPRIIEEHGEFYDTLSDLVQVYEAPSAQPWRFELPDDYVQKMMRAIVGVSIRITRLEGKYKLSQNRSPEDQRRVAAVLQAQGEGLGQDVGVMMQQRLDHVDEVNPSEAS